MYHMKRRKSVTNSVKCTGPAPGTPRGVQVCRHLTPGPSPLPRRTVVEGPIHVLRKCLLVVAEAIAR